MAAFWAVGLILCGPMRGDAIVPQVMLRAGDVLVEVETRGMALRRLDQRTREDLCGKPRLDWPSEPAVKIVRPDRQPGQKLVMSLMEAAAVTLAFDDRRALESIVENLDRWARNDAMAKRQKKRRAREYYNIDRSLMPMIVAFSLVRGHADVDPVKIARIEAWLRRLVDMRRGRERFFKPSLGSSRNNHRYLADSVTMAWGAVTGDAVLFDKGIYRFRVALDQARGDGSLPLETARGRKALHYQRHAVGSLVAIAEMAALQGVDLYSWRNERGQTIHDLVDFLVRAIDDGSVLEPYARQPQDFGFLEERGHGRHYMAWFEPYAARFGQRETVIRLRELLREHGYRGEPMIDDYFGSMTTCFFRPLPEADGVTAAESEAAPG
ncbi:MAG: alginate lyase family protein [Geminicoccaceae bacterium]